MRVKLPDTNIDHPVPRWIRGDIVEVDTQDEVAELVARGGVLLEGDAPPPLEGSAPPFNAVPEAAAPAAKPPKAPKGAKGGKKTAAATKG